MGDREIDRAAWAAIVSRAIAEETAGNKSRFAAILGVTYKTLNRWLNLEVDVSEESVRALARQLRRPARDLLLQVGYYQEDDLDSSGDGMALDPEDEALQEILASGAPPRTQRRMIERLKELRARQRTIEVDEVRWWLDQAKDA